MRCTAGNARGIVMCQKCDRDMLEPIWSMLKLIIYQREPKLKIFQLFWKIPKNKTDVFITFSMTMSTLQIHIEFICPRSRSRSQIHLFSSVIRQSSQLIHIPISDETQFHLTQLFHHNKNTLWSPNERVNDQISRWRRDKVSCTAASFSSDTFNWL